MFLGPRIARNTSDLISMVSLTFTVQRHLQLASAPFTSFHLIKVGWVPLISACEAWQWSRKQNLRRVGKNSSPILTRLWTKVQEIFRRRKRPFVLSNTLADCLGLLSHFVQKIFAIRPKPWSRKTEQMYTVFWPLNFLTRKTPTFLRQIVTWFAVTPFGKVEFRLLNADFRLGSLTMKQNAEFAEGR